MNCHALTFIRIVSFYLIHCTHCTQNVICSVSIYWYWICDYLKTLLGKHPTRSWNLSYLHLGIVILLFIILSLLKSISLDLAFSLNGNAGGRSEVKFNATFLLIFVSFGFFMIYVLFSLLTYRYIFVIVCVQCFWCDCIMYRNISYVLLYHGGDCIYPLYSNLFQ